MSFSLVRLTVYAKSLSPIAVLWFMETHWQRHDVYTSAKRSVNKLGNGTSMTPGTPQNAAVTKYTDMHTKNFEHLTMEILKLILD